MAKIRIETDTATLARVMGRKWGGVNVRDWNAGCHPGTKIPLRALTGTERVVVAGSETGASIIECDTWIADRFGRLGARDVRALQSAIAGLPFPSDD